MAISHQKSRGDKLIRVLVLSNMYPGKRSLTYGIFVKNQVESLRKRNMIVDVVAIDDPRMGKKYALMKYGKWALKCFVNFLIKGKQYDIIHAHYVYPTGVIGLLYKKWLKNALFVTAHGGDIDRMARRNKKIFQKTKEILEGADHVIAVGHQLKKDIVEDFSINENKVSVLNMGVNREVFYPMDKKEAAHQIGLDPQSFHILYVGNFIKEKGLEELAAAFLEVERKYKNVQLHLIGSKKSEDFYNHLTKLFGNKLNESVHIYPAKPQKELAMWMSAANLFVLPSHIEGFGLVALEAMACGTPVVGTEVGGLKYLLAGGCGLAVPPRDEKQLASAIFRCFEDPELVRNMVDKGQEKAEINSEERMINALCELYKQQLKI
jgi:glycosyltransferase involved in cell wall biosynthesis